MHQLTPKPTPTHYLTKISATAALVAGVIFLLPILDLLIAWLQPSAANAWLAPFRNIWLVIIFKLIAGFDGVHSNLLSVLNFLDIAILALFGTVCFGLYAALKKSNKIWSLIALALPFLGIVIFIVTKIAGRSSLMAAGLVISVVMLRDITFGKITAYVGILASVLLLIGDFCAGSSPSILIAGLFGIGYLLLVIWLFRVARRLFL